MDSCPAARGTKENEEERSARVVAHGMRYLVGLLQRRSKKERGRLDSDLP